MLKNEDPKWCELIARELGDAIAALNEDPAMLLELTGTRKKERKENQPPLQEVDEASSITSHGVIAAESDDNK